MTEATPPVDPDSLDFDDLEPLAELPEIEELDELEPFEPEPAVKPAAEAAAAKPESATAAAEALPDASLEAIAGASAASAASGGNAGSEGFQLRELDKAPTHLRKAALIAVAGSLFPWLGHGGSWITCVGAKALVFAGMGLLYLYWKYRGGESVPGAIAKLSDIGLIPEKKKDEEEKKPRRKKDAVADPSSFLRGSKFPAAIHLFAFAIIIAGVILPKYDPGTAFGAATAEIGMLAWGLGALVHIYAYQRWSKFNPIFPLMFLAHGISGVLSALKGFGPEGTPWMIAGGALVGAGGVYAAWTIIVALREAKAEGDAKKAAAAEARRAARKKRS